MRVNVELCDANKSCCGEGYRSIDGLGPRHGDISVERNCHAFDTHDLRERRLTSIPVLEVISCNKSQGYRGEVKLAGLAGDYTPVSRSSGHLRGGNLDVGIRKCDAVAALVCYCLLRHIITPCEGQLRAVIRLVRTEVARTLVCIGDCQEARADDERIEVLGDVVRRQRKRLEDLYLRKGVAACHSELLVVSCPFRLI